MLLRMLSTRPGSPDGRMIKQYQHGEVYDLPGEDGALGQVFLSAGWAERFSPEPALETMRMQASEKTKAPDTPPAPAPLSSLTVAQALTPPSGSRTRRR